MQMSTLHDLGACSMPPGPKGAAAAECGVGDPLQERLLALAASSCLPPAPARQAPDAAMQLSRGPHTATTALSGPVLPASSPLKTLSWGAWPHFRAGASAHTTASRGETACPFCCHQLTPPFRVVSTSDRCDLSWLISSKGMPLQTSKLSRPLKEPVTSSSSHPPRPPPHPEAHLPATSPAEADTLDLMTLADCCCNKLLTPTIDTRHRSQAGLHLMIFDEFASLSLMPATHPLDITQGLTS